MSLRTLIASRFPVKIPVFDIHAHREAHVGIGRQLFAGGPGGRRPAELKNGCVAPGNHVRAHFNLDRAAVAGVGDELPHRWRSGGDRSEVVEVEGRNEAVGIDPDPDALGENVAVHRQSGMQIRAQHAIVFGLHAPQIRADPRHAADAVGEQDPIGVARREMRWQALRLGPKKTNGGGHVRGRRVVALQNQIGIDPLRARRETSNVTRSDCDGLGVLGDARFARFAPRRQGGAKRHAVLDEQPVTGGNRSDAAAIHPVPADDFRQGPRCGGLVQGSLQRRNRARFESPDRGQELEWGAVHDFRQRAPVEASDVGERHDFAQRLDAPGRLSAGAPIGVTAQTGGPGEG